MDEVTTSSRLSWKWHRLAHVCQTWRDIIFSSSRHLNLELLCTDGTPVRKNLGYLPVLPIVISFPCCIEDSDEDNILAALEHPDRVRDVELYVPYSLFEKMATVMQRPFPALTRLWLQSNDDEPMLVLPDAFLGGRAPCLQTIYLDGIPFPAAPTLLLSARNLIDINLCDIPDTGYISPEATVASLAALSGLKYLTLGFRMGTSYPDPIRLPPITRTVLPALTTFFFNGLFEYLEDFVAQIDTPQLNKLAIEYLDEDDDLDFPIPQLCRFIDRSEKLKLSQFRRVDLDLQPFGIKLDGGRSSLKFSVQFSGTSQLLSQICGMLSNVDRLFISSMGKEYKLGYHEYQWPELLRPFTAVKVLRIQGEVSRCVALELGRVTGENAAEVLPALESLCLEDQLVTSVKEFVAARQSVGRPVTVINNGREFQERLGPNVSE